MIDVRRTEQTNYILQHGEKACLNRGSIEPENIDTRQTITFGYIEVSKANRERFRLCPPHLVVVIRYEDVIGNQCERAFRAQQSLGWDSYLLSGGPVGNYDREID